MTAIDVMMVEPGQRPSPTPRDPMPSGLALSASLHVGLIALIVFGLPSLFRHPPVEETPIAVELVTIAPDTRATHPNPYRPKPQAKPEPAIAPPAPEPKPKPPPEPAAAPPPSAAAAAAAAPAPAPPKPAIKPPPPPPPKPLEAQTPAPRPPEPKPKPEPQQASHAPPHSEKADPAAFEKLINKLEDKPPQRHPEPGDFDALLKNLTRTQTDEAEQPTPARPVAATGAAPSSQPQAPLGSQLTASEIDLLRQQIERCWDIPVGARDAQDLNIEIKAVVGRDGTVQQAAIVDTGRYAADPFFRAAADSAKRALLNPRCSPLPLPPDKYEAWHNLDLTFNPKDLI